MFSRLYVLIQENLTNFNIEGLYSENEIYNRKYNLNKLHPFNKYFIRGPFSVNSNIQNNTVTNPIMNSSSNLFTNTYNSQNNNSFMNTNNTFNTHSNQFLKPQNLFNNQFVNSYNSNFKINDKNMDID